MTVFGLNTNSSIGLPTLTTHTVTPPAARVVVPAAVGVALPPRPCRVKEVAMPMVPCPVTDSVIASGGGVADVAPVPTKPPVLGDVEGSTVIVSFLAPWEPTTDSVIAGGG